MINDYTWISLEGDVATVRKTISLSEQQDRWVKARIEDGDFTNDSEYIRALIRRDQEENAKYLALKAAINDGLASGNGGRGVSQIMDDVERRLLAGDDR